jgi:hypothetical protein
VRSFPGAVLLRGADRIIVAFFLPENGSPIFSFVARCRRAPSGRREPGASWLANRQHNRHRKARLIGSDRGSAAPHPLESATNRQTARPRHTPARPTPKPTAKEKTLRTPRQPERLPRSSRAPGSHALAVQKRQRQVLCLGRDQLSELERRRLRVLDEVFEHPKKGSSTFCSGFGIA